MPPPPPPHADRPTTTNLVGSEREIFSGGGSSPSPLLRYSTPTSFPPRFLEKATSPNRFFFRRKHFKRRCGSQREKMANLLGKKTSVLPPPRSYFESAWGSSDSTVKQARFTRVAPSLDGTVRLRRPPRPRTPGRSKRSCRSQEGGRRQIEAINRTYSSSFSLSSPPPPLVPVKPRSLVCNLRPPSAGGRPQSVGSGGIPVCSLPPGIPREEQMAETHWRVLQSFSAAARHWGIARVLQYMPGAIRTE